MLSKDSPMFKKLMLESYDTFSFLNVGKFGLF